MLNIFFIILISIISSINIFGNQDSFLKRKFLEKFEKSYKVERLEQCMPYIKKYWDREDLRLELTDIELTKYANDYLKSVNIKNREALILVAQDNDPIFAITRGALVIDCIDKLIIILQRDFVKNYSRKIQQACVMHELSHFINNEVPYRYSIVKLYQKINLLIPGLLSLMSLVACEKKFPSLILKTGGIFISSFIIQGIIFNLVFSKQSRNNELKADKLAALNCGQKDSLDMLDALYELIGGEAGRSFIYNLFASHPPISERKKAIL